MKNGCKNLLITASVLRSLGLICVIIFIQILFKRNISRTLKITFYLLICILIGGSFVVSLKLARFDCFMIEFFLFALFDISVMISTVITTYFYERHEDVHFPQREISLMTINQETRIDLSNNNQTQRKNILSI